MQIRYARDPYTLNFIVSLPALNQRIIVLPDVMFRFVGVHPRAVLGSTTITPDVAAAIGFLVNGDHPAISFDRGEVTERDAVPA